MADLEETLIIIDADAESARHLKEHLDSQGFYVEIFSSLADFTPKLDELSPDLVIGDLPTSELSAVTRMVAPLRPRPPLIVISQDVSSGHILSALRAGAAGFVAKPMVDTIEIDHSISRLMERVRLSRENQQYRLDLEQANKSLKAGLEELQADHKAGRQIQMKMLPEHNLEFDNISFDHCIKPSLYLSGDFFDYFPVSDTQVAFYFADVSGHGASSAFVTVLLKNLANRLQRNLRRHSSDDVLHPDRFLSRVNTEILETDMGKHLTMFAGIIDTEYRVLTYSVGAHFPMPILSVNGHSRYLEGKGPPVGLFEDPKFPVYEEDLAPGFSLVICSDGLLEVINAKSLAEKEERLLETVQSASHTIASLEKAFRLDWVTELPDDIAIVSILESAV
ncbi:PP2C family protein-serine/threonine phosphatase [Hahella ganghwensis]|uniref:PP2C family protein-serine/threonine phosphatase n=1 Tax=Hahella ganghwensis TaxID=286420 RepID=UPI00037C703E|nr:SpoIIE family protein phosphatase [Hahella ganghwensis]